MRYLPVIILLLPLLVVSCKKSEDPAPEQPVPAEQKGTVRIRFYNKAGDSTLVLHTTGMINDTSLVLQPWEYVNENLDTFYVNTLKYYISNIKLKRADNTEFVQPESYYLIDQSQPGSTTITITDVPVGNYTGLSFMIGVDSTRNCSGVQTGALDPANAMFWTWNTGYIFFKIEGKSPQIASDYFFYHIGGFTGQYKAMRTTTLPFGSTGLSIQSIGASEIGVDADILEVFKTPYTIGLSANYSIVTAGSSACRIADNYADMFSISYLYN